MISRLYIDNFLCMTNFEIRPGRFQLWSGSSGTGKSTALQCLRRLRTIVAEGEPVESAFPGSTLTSSGGRRTQTFSFTLSQDGDNGTEPDEFTYGLQLEHFPARRLAHIKKESLLWNGKEFYRFDGELAHLYRICHEDKAVVEGTSYPADWSRSMIHTIPERTDNGPVIRFRNAIRDMVAIQPIPILMSQIADDETNRLDIHCENFAHWYRFLLQENMEITSGLFHNLKEAIPSFRTLRLKEAGDARKIRVTLAGEGDAQEYEYDFNDLSDGQRQLIVLYAILEAFKAGVIRILVLDEPDSFLALREIQPWVMELQDAVDASGRQAILISHHPEILNRMADDSQCCFTHNAAGHIEAKPFPVIEGLTPADIYARGWNDE